MELTSNHGIGMDSWYRHGLVAKTWTYGIHIDSWYRHGLMVFNTPMVLTQTDGLLLVLLNHTHIIGPSVEGFFNEV